MYSCIIWDFNGTILDDVGIGIESINSLLSARGLPIIECRADYQKLFRFPIVEYYADLGLDVKEYDALAVEWVEQYLSRLDGAPLHAQIVSVLDWVRSQGITQVILSATEQRQLLGQVKALGIVEYFESVLGLDNIHAASKVEMALRWKNEAERGNLLLIGDTDHDLQTARALGADCVLVSYGHQSRKALERLGVPVFDSAQELIPHISAQKEA